MSSASAAANGGSGSAPNPVIIWGEKPEKFTGVNFKRWYAKMVFYLTMLNLTCFLSEDPPSSWEQSDKSSFNWQSVGDGPIQVGKMTIEEWNHGDYMCKNYILNGMSDTLYTVYCSVKTSKELWKSLEKKYNAKDAGTKKFIVGKFMNFKMVDSKCVNAAYQRLTSLIDEM